MTCSRAAAPATAAIILLCATSCERAEPREPRSIAIVFDLSASTPPELYSLYGSWAKDLLAAAGANSPVGFGDQVVLTRVSDRSLSEPHVERIEIAAAAPEAIARPVLHLPFT